MTWINICDTATKTMNSTNNIEICQILKKKNIEICQCLKIIVMFP